MVCRCNGMRRFGKHFEGLTRPSEARKRERRFINSARKSLSMHSMGFSVFGVWKLEKRHTLSFLEISFLALDFDVDRSKLPEMSQRILLL